MVLSDHNPITITLTIPMSRLRHQIWHIDHSLLTDPVIATNICTCLTQYFTENVNDESAPTTVWAAHKCIIRGESLSLIANKNRLKRERIAALSAKIHMLERAHKLSLAAQSYADLLKAREDLLEVLGKTIRRKYTLTQKLFYEYGNKSGKYLARVLQLGRATNTVNTIRDPTGKAYTSSEDITNQFVQYFSRLYNLRHTSDSGHLSEQRELRNKTLEI